jgi:phage shock protein C
MSRRTFRTSPWRWPQTPRGLYRDPPRGRIAGVCAGIAAYYQVKPRMLRALLIVGCICGFFIPLIAFYVLLVMILPPLSERPDVDHAGWPSSSSDPGSVRRRFEALDRRLAHMEGWVTSEDYRLRQQFKDL